MIRVAAADTNSPGTAASYSLQIAKCEQDGDWLQTVELLTETRILSVKLDFSTQEAAVRTLAKGKRTGLVVLWLRSACS